MGTGLGDPMMLGAGAMRRFIPVSLAQACAEGLRTQGGAPMVTPVAYLPQATTPVPPISFGTTSLDGLPLRQTPADSAAGSQYTIGPLDRMVIQDAVVHGRAGYVTCGDHIFTDFLSHIPLHLLPGVGPTGDGGYSFPDTPPALRLADAVHGSSSNLENYFHWTIDAMIRFDPALLQAPAAAHPTVALMPQPLNRWQQQLFDLLPRSGAPVLRLDHGGAVAVERLVSGPSLCGGGFFFHPDALRLPQVWRRRLDPDTAPTPGPRFRRIYISRQDSGERRLVNEAAVEALVRRLGFEVVQLSGLDVTAQIRLFAASSRIIAPHGAGLTNLLYCRPGASVLELHMDGYVQWAFRRIAGLIGARYGCVIGRTVEPWHDWPHANSWTVDLDEVAAAVAVM